MAEIERATIAAPIAASARDVKELRRRRDAGKASGLAGEIKIGDLIADEKTKRSPSES
jgi:hypothetical protein